MSGAPTGPGRFFFPADLFCVERKADGLLWLIGLTPSSSGHIVFRTLCLRWRHLEKPILNATEVVYVWQDLSGYIITQTLSGDWSVFVNMTFGAGGGWPPAARSGELGTGGWATAQRGLFTRMQKYGSSKVEILILKLAWRAIFWEQLLKYYKALYLINYLYISFYT